MATSGSALVAVTFLVLRYLEPKDLPASSLLSFVDDDINVNVERGTKRLLDRASFVGTSTLPERILSTIMNDNNKRFWHCRLMLMLLMTDDPTITTAQREIGNERV